jgi:hypothetical protein
MGTETMTPPNIPMQRGPGWNGWLAANERLVIAGFALALLGVNLWTSLWYPTNWMDEVMFSDPAISYLRGEGLTSTVWWQSRELTWSGNVPLYTLALIPWFKLVGVSLVKARTFNYLIMSITAVIFWLGVKRLKLVAAPAARVAMIAVVLLSYSMSFAYRSARPDCLGMLICAAALLAWSWQNRTAGNACLFAAGFLAPFSGLQLAAYAGFLCFAVWLMSEKRDWFRPLLILAGVGLGAAVLFAYYRVNHLTGVSETIAAARRYHESAAAGGHEQIGFVAQAVDKLRRILLDHFKEYGLAPMLAALGILACDRRMWSVPGNRSLLFFGVLSSLAIVSALEIFLHYLDYYHWMNFVLLAVVLFTLLGRLWIGLCIRKKALICLCLAAAIAGGLPLRLALGLAVDQSREYKDLEAVLRQELRRDDVVFSDFMAYFPAKAMTGEVYAPPYLNIMTEREKRSVNVLILDPINFEGYSGYFTRDGSQWSKVAEVIPQPDAAGRWVNQHFPHYRLQPTSCGYTVTILRRKAP